MKTEGTTASHPFRALVSTSSLLSCLIAAVGIGYGVGIYSRQALQPPLANASSIVEPGKVLPATYLPPGKKLPPIVYTSKDFFQSSAPTNTQMAQPATDWTITQMGTQLDANELPPSILNDDEEHLPAGQHLMVDLENVDGDFLNSKHRLAGAMLALVNQSGLTLLSYHCHQQDAVGVSCVGVLLESHVAFHTKPLAGTLTLDLFTCGPKSLLDLVPLVEQLFGVARPAVEATKPVRSVWIHKNRGFRSHRSNPEDVDRDRWVLGWRGYESKKLLASVDTPFQNVQIFDVVNTRFRDVDAYERSLTEPDSYEAHNPDLFKHDRIVYLDNIMQSRLFGEAAYHEALVHPAMVTHGSPRRVAIIGGGEGATLREALKWKTVEKVVMLEIDEGMVDASRAHLPEWSDCSKIGHRSCFDDPRADVQYTDAVAWFIDRFASGAESTEEGFDVIVMDALDPSSAVDFSDIMYKNSAYVESLFNALNENGVFVVQVGDDEMFSSPRRALSPTHQPLEEFIRLMEETGFQSVKEYAESHGGFMAPWHFVIAMKNGESQTNWYGSEPEVNLRLQKGLHPASTESGNSSPLRFFDGATMMTYQYPTRINEEVYCLTEPTPPLCEKGHGFHPDEVYAQVEERLEISGPTRRVMQSIGLSLASDDRPAGVVLESPGLFANQSTCSAVYSPYADRNRWTLWMG